MDSRVIRSHLKFLQQDTLQNKKFGIGSHVSNMDVSGLCVVKSEPPVWFCDVAGQRVELTTDDLQTPQRFQSLHGTDPQDATADEDGCGNR